MQVALTSLMINGKIEDIDSILQRKTCRQGITCKDWNCANDGTDITVQMVQMYSRFHGVFWSMQNFLPSIAKDSNNS